MEQHKPTRPVPWSIRRSDRGDWEYDVDHSFDAMFAPTYEQARDAVVLRLMAIKLGVKINEPRYPGRSVSGEVEVNDG